MISVRIGRRARALLACAAVAVCCAPAARAATPAPGYAVSDFATAFPITDFGPIGLAFDPARPAGDPRLYVGDYSNGVIYRFDSGGGVADAAHALNPLAPIAGNPDGLAFDSSGRLYVALQTLGRVAEISTTDAHVIRYLDPFVPCAAGIATDPLSGDLMVTAVSCSGIGVYRISNYAASGGTATAYGGPSTDGITIGPDGT